MTQLPAPTAELMPAAIGTEAVEFEVDVDPLGPPPEPRRPSSGSQGDETRVRHAARITALKLYRLCSGVRDVSARMKARSAQLCELDSARGHIRRTVVLTGGLTAICACTYAIINFLGLAYFEEPALLVFGYSFVGLSVASLGCFAVTLRVTRCLACFATISYLMALAFGAFSVSMASISIAAFVANQRYRLGAGVVSSVCLVFSLVFALLVFLWAAAAQDARVTRMYLLLRGIPGAADPRARRRQRRSDRRPCAGWVLRTPVAGGARDDGARGDADVPPALGGIAARGHSGHAGGGTGDGDGQDSGWVVAGGGHSSSGRVACQCSRGSPAAAASAAPLARADSVGFDLPAPLSVRANSESLPGAADPGEDPGGGKLAAGMDEVGDGDERLAGRRALTLVAALGVPLFVAGCLLLYPLVFSNNAAVDVELLLVGSRLLVGEAHVAWEGAMGELFRDENTRPSVRSIGLPEGKAHGRWFRGVPMLPALARWRAAGVLLPRERAPVQLVLFVLHQRFVEDEPPRSPPPPAAEAAARLGEEDVPALGSTYAHCVRALLRMDTLGLGSGARGKSRLDALGLSDADLQRLAAVRTRGGEPSERPRSVALADFDVVCFRGSDLQPDSFWQGALEALGEEAVAQPACGVAAGVVGGMGPLAGAIYQQRLGALLHAHVQAVAAPNSTHSREYAEEAARACVETYSNPQLAVDVRALLQTVGDSERLLIEQRTFLARPDFSSFAGPSNAWYEISFRLLVSAPCAARTAYSAQRAALLPSGTPRRRPTASRCAFAPPRAPPRRARRRRLRGRQTPRAPCGLSTSSTRRCARRCLARSDSRAGASAWWRRARR